MSLEILQIYSCAIVIIIILLLLQTCLAENINLALKTMRKLLLDFLDAYLLCSTINKEAYHIFDE